MTRATMLGSWPGTDFPAAQRIALHELPELSHLVELPARGPGSGLIGRTAVLLEGLSVDLQPSGWRITDAAGIDQRRALADWRRDLDDLEEQSQGFTGDFVVSFCGPWTLVANLEKSRGDKILGDHGARRDVIQALAVGVQETTAEIARRMPGARVLAQLDEPMLPRVAEAGVPTASGFGRHRAIHPPELSEGLETVRRAAVAAAGSGAGVLHCCAPGLDVDLVLGAGFGAVALDARFLDGRVRDQLGPALEDGRELWLGVAGTDDPNATLPGVDRLARRALQLVRPFELGPEVADRLVLTPACGLAGWRAAAATALIRDLRRASEIVAEELAR